MASVIIVVIIFVLLALAILFICQNGGWQGGCGGNVGGTIAIVAGCLALGAVVAIALKKKKED